MHEGHAIHPINNQQHQFFGHQVVSMRRPFAGLFFGIIIKLPSDLLTFQAVSCLASIFVAMAVLTSLNLDSFLLYPLFPSSSSSIKKKPFLSFSTMHFNACVWSVHLASQRVQKQSCEPSPASVRNPSGLTGCKSKALGC